MTITTQEAVDLAQPGCVGPLGPAAQGPGGPSSGTARIVDRAASAPFERASDISCGAASIPSEMRTRMRTCHIVRHHSSMARTAFSHSTPRPGSCCDRMRPASPTTRP